MDTVKLELLLTPSPGDCLAWSDDGLLAIAALEDVHVLIPKRPRRGTRSNFPQWARIKFKANQFHPTEWPLLEPRSSKNMAIGEEQSESTVSAIAWSPLGLARHRRPVLAVLTSNHLLSIWASSKIEESKSWHRTLVINAVDSKPPQIRSMAWGPIFRPPNSNTTRKREKGGLHILAIGLDDGSLHFFQISSPFAAISETWRYERLCWIDLRSTLTMSPRQDRYSLFWNVMESLHFFESISFSPWTERDDGPETIISVCKGGITSHIRLFVDKDAAHTKFELYHNDTPRDGHEADLDIHQNLQGPQDVRIMGFARQGSILAVCTTKQASHEVTYRGPAEDNSWLNFEHIEGSTQLPWQKPIDIQDKTLEAILAAVIDPDLFEVMAISPISLRILYAMLMASVLVYDMREAKWLSRAQRLLVVIERSSGELKEERKFLAQLANDKMANGNAETSNIEHIKEINWARGEHFYRQGLRATGFEPLLEDCPACKTSAPLAYSGTQAAMCRAGHSFDLCDLTLLPIVNPRWLKTCVDCQREFLDEYKHPEINIGLTSDRETLITRDAGCDGVHATISSTGDAQWLDLANSIFGKFDQCPYCGGYFTG